MSKNLTLLALACLVSLSGALTQFWIVGVNLERKESNQEYV